MTRKQRRLTLIGAGLGVLGLAAGLVLYALNDAIGFFNSPSDVVGKNVAPGARIPLGGPVKPGRPARGGNLSVRFEVTRGHHAGACISAAASFAALTAAYVGSDFPVLNVFENSHSAMPLIYKFTSVWGNHEGSMLLWVLILALFGALVALFGSNLPDRLKANVLAVQAWIACAFYFFILVTSNPFPRIAQAPAEGRDLNPILQDIGLAVHPPLLYLGYVGFSISFSFPIPALSRATFDAPWATWGR